MTKQTTHPAVTPPTSATHWTCPKAPGDGMTHHMVGTANKCAYCHRDAADLREEQAQLIAEK